MGTKDSVTSTLTDRYQTTVPEAVRRALKLSKRDQIAYTIRPDGSVELRRADAEAADPVLETFLTFLARDMQNHPERLQQIDTDLAERVNGLVGNIEVDLDQPLPAEEE
ncbi:type II toxin-antitoxin system PrlF family antitoxin [Rhodovibrio salinarum]|uniref:Regulator n=1 Tax=Rhodovibrio salinarum TaxID=1087 RepID=A0A934V354_9PROT|nr:type II toxin-antitoxin system PrlF family antitoxin [Rhodovibrio salinarum]MBK1699311.1 regulator [Rhodovibrio salinarum]